MGLKASWKLSWDVRYTAIEWLFEAGLTATHEVHVALNKAINEEDEDVKLVKLLLGKGASPLVNKCKTLVDATASVSLIFLPLLLDRDISQGDLQWTFSQGLEKDNSEAWFTEDGLKVAELLLAKGASGDGVNEALCTVLEMHTDQTLDLANKFVELLASHGAGIDHENGRPLQLAASAGHIAWVKQLLDGNPSSRSMSMGLLHAFDKEIEPSDALSIVHLFVNHEGERVDVHITDGKPILVRALERYPRSVEIFKALLDAGYYHDQTTTCQVLPEVEEEEPVTILTWALLQPQKRIGSAIIEMLITKGAAINVETRLSRARPLMLAVRAKRQDIVQILLLEGAEVDVVDATGNTPLSMASALGGDLAISFMGNILAAGASCNDGSLHNAARELNLPAIQILARYGHDVDFPSHRHSGRSALGELVLHATEYAELTATKERTMEKVIAFLLDQGSDISIQSEGKSCLLLALSAADPVATTRTLLKAGVWKQINQKFNIYSDGKYSYSPTMYVQKVLKSEHSEELISLLRANRCEDVFYADTGPQPDGAVGLPEDLAIGERQRKARQDRIATEAQDNAILIERERDRAAAQAQIFEQQANREGLHRQKLHQDQLAARRQLALLDDDIFNNQLRLKRGERIAELSHQASITDATVNRAKAVGRAHLEIEDGKAAKMLTFEDKMGRARVENEAALSAVRVGERQDLEGMEKAADGRIRGRIEAQRKLVEGQEKLAGRLTAGGVPRRQVGYIMGEES